MHLNIDFSQRAVVRFDDSEWVASTMSGVQRRTLERIGGEVACATSIVRFKPGSAFSPHTHVYGEEYLVLDDTSQHEDGEFPIGIYERTPSTSSQTPAELEGARVRIKTRHLRLIGEAPA
ncbi:MAG: cupin domain-containing protein [Kiritimatiellia bacterium]